VTLALAIGLQRMARRNALVRRLPAVETLGAVTVICTDKTGTLTRNEMTVRAIVAGGTAYRVEGSGYSPSGSIVPLESADALFAVDGAAAGGAGAPGDADLVEALRIASWCNHARLVPPAQEGEWSVLGDPTEAALKVAARKARVDDPPPGVEAIHEIPFDPERRAMSIAWRGPDGRRWLTTKGAPEAILERCASERLAGVVRPLTPERRAEILALDSRLAADALRVLAVADRTLEPGDAIEERDLVFSGLFAMLDPPRDEARAAVATCRASGIQPVMITGDHPATAIAIARALAIAAPGHVALTGRDLDRMDDDALERRVEGVTVYARVSAEHKLRVVRAWKARGQVVAMTGDGVNDAPAVQAADIGIAMGRTGTDVTREAAAMVLLDDNFASIVSAVREGRGIFDNIRKFVHYLLSTNAGEILLMFVAALAGWPAPLIAVQILWINLVTDGLPALALGVEPPERDIMERPPRSPREPVITPRGGVSILVHGVLVAAVAAAGFVWAHGGDEARLGHARTVAFCVTAYAQLLYAFAFRSQTRTLPELGLFSNRPLLGAVLGAALLQLAAVELPFARPFFGVERPLASDWGVVLALALIPVTLAETWKIVRVATTRGRAER
jgi:Ca2+-transporting ATPase